MSLAAPARFIPDGGLVAPGPLLHVPDAAALAMYKQDPETGLRVPDEVTGEQLILNYCFGHGESTVLLCPYTSPSAYINHSSESPNVRVEWADEGTLGHNAVWLDESADFLKRQSHVGLSVNFVATRDIRPGEEVFLDYGAEWQQAWDDYVEQWIPPDGSDRHINAYELEKDRSLLLRTATEQHSDPYPGNIVFYCHYDYSPEHGSNPEPWTWDEDQIFEDLTPCKILDRYEGEEENEILYRVIMMDQTEIHADLDIMHGGHRDLDIMHGGLAAIPPAGDVHIIEGVPRSGIKARDKLYSKDEFLPGSFRHEMMFPDDIFPHAWRNLR